VFAGGLAAILASTCCLGPLTLVALGFNGAWIGNLTALEPYRPIFIGLALVAISLLSVVVTFDDTKTTVEALTKATESAGYPSTVKP